MFQPVKATLALMLLAACTQCAPSPTPQLPPRDPTAGTPSAPSVNEDPTRSQESPIPPRTRQPTDRSGERAARPSPERKPSAGGGGLQGKTCPENGQCGGGMTCVHYYGIAGPRGPEFTSCEFPCENKGCPEDQRCVTIADGPGRVCRPQNDSL